MLMSQLFTITWFCADHFLIDSVNMIEIREMSHGYHAVNIEFIKVCHALPCSYIQAPATF